MKIFYPFALILLFTALQLPAQVNRANTKKSVPYRANYQRTSSGSSASHTLEIRNGALWACGRNTEGQLGDGTTTQRNSPVQIGTDITWISIAAGYKHSLGLKSDGTLWAWGQNSYGQIGDGTTTQRNSPVQIGMDVKWISIACGLYNSLALKSDGSLWVWGNNDYGQLGDGTTIQRNDPVQIITDSKWKSIVTGGNHSLGLKSDGTLWAWGANSVGQLGDGTTIPRISPVQIGIDTKWVGISAGNSHTLGLKADGTLWSWGNNYSGQLGDGSNMNKSKPVQIGADKKWIKISAGLSCSHGLKSDGTLWAWGNNDYGQLGDATNINRSNPVQTGTDNKWVNIEAAGRHSYALKSDGTLWSWGDNYTGQLGDGGTTNRNTPGLTSIVLSEWLNVNGGFYHNLGLKSDGTLWSWGFNGLGQLGDGTTIDKITPVRVGTDNIWVSITAGLQQSFGLKSDGTLWAWGYNSFGQLGDGTKTSRSNPTQIGTDNKWEGISAGEWHTIGLKSDGTIWSWGDNLNGQLGDGTNTQRLIPVQIGTDSKWVSIAAGRAHSLGIKSDGTLWGWGSNGYGQIGDGTQIDRNIPVQIGTDNKWELVSGGFGHSYGLKSDGTIWSWGWNIHSELGDETSVEYRFSPVQIGLDNKWVGIRSGYYHGIALKTDGTIWAWGWNNFGQFGNGTSGINVESKIPLQAGIENNWKTIGIAHYNSVAIKSDQTLFCATGYNEFGQLGDGSLINKSIFVCNTNAICVVPLMPIAFNKSACRGSTASLSATGIGTLGWYSAATGGTWLGGGPLFITPVLTATTTYYVQDSTCAASPRKAVVVTVNPLPIVTANASATVVCAGTTVILTGSGAATYTWSGGVSNGVGFIPLTTASYTVTGTDTNGCVAVSAPITITVNNGTNYYADEDSDGFGNPTVFLFSCTQPLGYVLNKTDNCPNIYNPTQIDADGDGIGDTCDNLNLPAIISGEFFIDIDPGVGNASAFTFSKTDSINITRNFVTDNLTNGFHQLFIRLKDFTGKWSIAEQRAFYVEGDLLQKPSPLRSGEYFFTTDTGVGTGLPLTFTKTDKLNKIFKIPVPNFPLGTQYLEMRVKDSSGRWSISESRNIQIVCKPDLGPNAAAKVCEGGKTDITTLFDYANYASAQWNTANPTSVGPGTYRLIVTSSLGCSDTAFVTVSTSAKPILGNDTAVSKCTGTAINLTTLYNTTGLTTQWNTARPDSVVAAGSYQLIAVNGTGCADTAIVTVSNNAIPAAPTISAGGSTTNVCPGKTVTLTSSSGTTYLWSTGAITQSIIVNTAGSYTVQVTNASGCKSASSTATLVTYLTCAKPAGLITSNIAATSTKIAWNAVNCAIGYQYEWRVKGTIPYTMGQQVGVSKTLTGLLPATTYQWRVITICKNTPDTITSAGYTNGAEFTTIGAITVTRKQEIPAGAAILSASIMPNPAASIATVMVKNASGTVYVKLTEISGKTLWQNSSFSQNTFTIDAGSLAQGTYMVLVKDDKETVVLKMVKE